MRPDEKILVLAYFVCLLGATILGNMLLALLAAALTLLFVVVLFRDINQRRFAYADSRFLWTILILLVPFPMAVVYLYKHGFRSRPEAGAERNTSVSPNRMGFGKVAAICAVMVPKMSLALPCLLLGYEIGGMGIRLEGFSPSECKGIGIALLLGGLGLGYPFSLLCANRLSKVLLTVLSTVPFVLTVVGLCVKESRADSTYWIVGGFFLVGIVMTLTDWFLSRRVNVEEV
jgi:hypothetical protein